jgi:hypothetical protein
MTLHGGGGGGIIGDIVDSVSDFISPVTDVFNDAVIQPISDVFAGADDLVFQPVTAPISQATSALDDAVIQPITEPISDVGVAIDDSVNEVIPGGWGTLAQIAATIATGGAGLGWTLAQQAALSAAIGAGTDFAKNKDIKSAIEKGAVTGATRYGLGTLGEMLGPTDVLTADDAYMGQAMNNLSNTASAIPEGAVTSLVPEATIQNTPFGPDVYPDAPPPVSGEIQMTDAGEFVNRNPDIQNAEFIPKKIELTPDLRLREDILNQANLDATYTGVGAKILKLVPGEGAEKAGIPAGSVIRSIDGVKTNDQVSAIVRIRSYAPGAVVNVLVDLPTGGQKSFKVTLGSTPSS